jgi:isoquinoline 1-oxidoreductase subunit beta
MSVSARFQFPRRDFLKTLGLAAGGLAFGLHTAEAAPSALPKVLTANPSIPPSVGLFPNVFVHVAPDGWVTLVCHRSEMGQGIRSSLPVLLADELGARMDKVKIAQGDGDKAYGDQNTDGSSSIRLVYDKLRLTAATARLQLITAAAKRWSVPLAECEARDHQITHTPTKRSLGFGELASAAGALPLPKPEDVPLRPQNELRRVGTELPLIDAPDYVTGKAIFGADPRLPGMLIAVIARPPVLGGTVKHAQRAAALAVPGVKQVLDLPVPKAPWAFQPLGGIAVLADTTWAAMLGREALAIEWVHGENVVYDSEKYRKSLLETVRKSQRAVRKVGDVEAARKVATRTLVADYYAPHLAHAPMEPPAALAQIVDGVCEVWAPTQNPQASRKEIARALGSSEDKVIVHVTLLGGAFGRKSKQDFVAEAAILAQKAGVPVRVQWTREDDLHHDYLHTVSAQHVEATLDADGAVTSWLHRSAFPPIASIFKDEKGPTDGELAQGLLDAPLAIPNLQIEAGDAPAHVRIGWLRSVCNIFHAFAVGSFVDEIAAARKVDPREQLLGSLGAPRLVGAKELGLEKWGNYHAPEGTHLVDVGRYRNVVERVTEHAEWATRQARGRHLGLAAHRSFLSYVAVVVSMVKNADDSVAVDEVWISIDAGLIVNPDRVRSQMEGAVLFGMSIALLSEITVKAGAVVQDNFRDYHLVRMADAPKAIHVDIVPSHEPPGGVGEPGVPPVAAAIANALFALTGKRQRELPLRPRSRAGGAARGG